MLFKKDIKSLYLIWIQNIQLLGLLAKQYKKSFLQIFFSFHRCQSNPKTPAPEPNKVHHIRKVRSESDRKCRRWDRHPLLRLTKILWVSCAWHNADLTRNMCCMIFFLLFIIMDPKRERNKVLIMNSPFTRMHAKPWHSEYLNKVVCVYLKLCWECYWKESLQELMEAVLHLVGCHWVEVRGTVVHN